MTRLIFALALLSSCAAVRPPLCAASDVALAQWAAAEGNGAAVAVGRFLRGLLCPRAPTGATDRLPDQPASL